jgi:V/A-type H+/Na+-transporting ATPase subunit F
MGKNFKIAIIGSSDAIGGFKAIGVEAIGVQSADDCRKKFLAAFDSPDYGILFITEDWAEKIKDVFNDLPLKALPSIVTIPAQSGSSGIGLANLKKIVEQAVGSDILGDD